VAELLTQPITELVRLLRAGELSAVDVATECLDAIEAREDDLHAWVTIDDDAVLARARQLDSIAPENRRALHGVPVGVKDIIDTADLPTEYGSPIYAGHRPDFDAEVVRRLRAAGALVIGKTVTTEFALFSPGPTTNPHDPARTPGGSSSGSAAAVGAGTVPLAVGTQTAGSIVRPASFCGVVGVKPTFGTIPVRGVKPCSPSLDTVGVFTRDVPSAAHVLRALVDEHARSEDDHAPRTIRIGFARTPEWQVIPSETRALVEEAVNTVAGGHDVREIELPAAFDGLVAAQSVVMDVEATRALADERANHGAMLSASLRERLAAGDRAAPRYDAASDTIGECRKLLADVFAPVDVLLAPSVLGEAPLMRDGTGDPVLCRAWTAVGTPAVAVPGLTGPNGLPLGIQVVAMPGRDDLALAGAQQVVESLMS
jgi:Asp-tRNA(Asn)/Glu-tRNA(Gln) amidotransferase A subunit family amidase